MRHGIAIVGASDRNFWTIQVRRNLERFGYEGELWPVNPNYETVGSLPAYPSLTAIDGTIDAAVLAVGAERCPAVVREAVGLGVQDLVVVANGFAERRDDAGDRLQRELVEACGPETRLYGPNCVGFADFRRKLCLIAQPVPEVEVAGGVSVISQSGAFTTAVMLAVLEDGGGIDWCVSLGNAAQFDLASAVAYAAERSTTKSILVYAETLGTDASRLSTALSAAREAGILVAMLKVGRSSVASRVAVSHTASVAGDDAQVSAFLGAQGVIRVETLEELARVGVLAPRILKDRGNGVVVIGKSGGQAAIAGDLAAGAGLKLAPLTPETRATLKEVTEPGSFIENPLDLVGRPGSAISVDEIYPTVFADETVGFALAPWSVMWPDDSEERWTHRQTIMRSVDAARETGTPAVICTLITTPWTDWILMVRREHPEVVIVRGISATIRALALLFPDADARVESLAPETSSDDATSIVTGEVQGRALLAGLGCSLVPGEAADDAEHALAAAEWLNGPLVVKLEVDGVAHRARLGLVFLGCEGREGVASAIDRAHLSLKEHGISSDRVTGYLVEEMASGTELLIGLTSSPLGRFVTIGAGGVAAGAGTSARTLLLPTTQDKLTHLLDQYSPGTAGSRGQADAVRQIASLSNEFLSGELADFDTVELNPMMVSQDAAAIVDVLMLSRAPADWQEVPA